MYGGFNTRCYTIVHSFCFFKLFPIGCIGLTVVHYICTYMYLRVPFGLLHCHGVDLAVNQPAVLRVELESALTCAAVPAEGTMHSNTLQMPMGLNTIVNEQQRQPNSLQCIGIVTMLN